MRYDHHQHLFSLKDRLVEIRKKVVKLQCTKRWMSSLLSRPQVLAGLLSMADRADWRNCKVSNEEEIQMVDDFKQGFREFDPAE